MIFFVENQFFTLKKQKVGCHLVSICSLMIALMNFFYKSTYSPFDSLFNGKKRYFWEKNHFLTGLNKRPFSFWGLLQPLFCPPPTFFRLKPKVCPHLFSAQPAFETENFVFSSVLRDVHLAHRYVASISRMKQETVAARKILTLQSTRCSFLRGSRRNFGADRLSV